MSVNEPRGEMGDEGEAGEREGRRPRMTERGDDGFGRKRGAEEKQGARSQQELHT